MNPLSVIPKKSASLIIIDPKTYKLLFIKRKASMNFGGQYAFPGGRLEKIDIELFEKNNLIDK